MSDFLALHSPMAYLAALLLAMALGFGWAFGNALGGWAFGLLSRPRPATRPG